jgi:hypothetical protein
VAVSGTHCHPWFVMAEYIHACMHELIRYSAAKGINHIDATSILERDA